MFNKGLKLVTARGTALLEITEVKAVNGVRIHSYRCEKETGVANEESMKRIIVKELEARPSLRVVGV